MATITIKGSILNQVFSAVEKNPKMTMGQIIYSALRGTNKLVELSDEEIYTAFEKFNQTTEEADTPFTEEEFNAWTEKVCK